MAIYSLNLGFVSRSAGRSSVSFSAYIGGGKGTEERTGLAYDYRHKNEVVSGRILAPEGAPTWAQNASVLWNKVEAFEDEIAALRFRGDPDDPAKNKKSLHAKEAFLASAQTAQTVMGAISLELTPEQAEASVEEFLQKRFVSRGLIVQYALHWENHNPHFHGMVTRRPLENGVFSQRKDREIVSKDQHAITRKTWEEVVNKHLARAGHEVRIDCRSKEDQGSIFLATEHEGWYAQKLAENGEYSRIVADNEAIRQKNIEILCHQPEALIKELTLKRTTFTHQHLEDEIVRRVGGDEKLYQILKNHVEKVGVAPELILSISNNNITYEGGPFAERVQILAKTLTDRLLSDDRISHFVGENINRQKVFTSAEYKTQEEAVLRDAALLQGRASKSVSKLLMLEAIETVEQEDDLTFSKEQRKAIKHLTTGPDLRVLNGKAGTGKTTLMKAVARAYEKAGYEVLGTSFQGKAVELMQQEIGIPCRTLDSYLYYWKEHKAQKTLVESGRLWGRPYLYAFQKMKDLEKHFFHRNQVLIVDEANMIGGHLWEPFLKEAQTKGAKVLIVQDPAQIKSREPGDYGRLLAEVYGCAETERVIRQKVRWQAKCSQLLNDHRVVDGIAPYQKKGHLQWAENTEILTQKLIQDYMQDVKKNPHQTRVVLAYRNEEVYRLNQRLRGALKSAGFLQEHFKINGLEYSLGDRIRFRTNDNTGYFIQNLKRQNTEIVGVKNGSFGTIEAYDPRKQTLVVALDTGRRIAFNTSDYQAFTHGYAFGIHKSEGSTFDRTFGIYDLLLDPASTLVLMSRHKLDFQGYVNQEQFVDFKDLVAQIGRGREKETLFDYQISEVQKPYFERVQQYRDLVIEAVTLREEMEGDLKPEKPLYKHKRYESYEHCYDQKKRVAEVILKDWEAHRPFVRLAGIRRDALEVETGMRPRLLSDLEQKAALEAQDYRTLAHTTRRIWRDITTTHPVALAKTHPLYETYQAEKTKRDVIASKMNKALSLYKPFFRVQEENGALKDFWGNKIPKGQQIYLATVKAHAAASEKAASDKAFYEGLKDPEKAGYNLLKSYVEMRNEAAALYGQLKKQEEVGGDLFLSVPQALFQKTQRARDLLALQVIDHAENCAPFLERFRLQDDKLIDHAIRGEMLEAIAAYQSEKDPVKRSTLAGDLKHKLTLSKLQYLGKDQGIEMSRLTFEAAFAKSLKEGRIEKETDPEKIYTSIQEYLQKERAAASLWKQVNVTREVEKKEAWREAFQVRNESAATLLGQAETMVVFGNMRGDVQAQLEKQSGYLIKEERPRGTQTYLSAEQVLEAAKDQAQEIAQSFLGKPNSRLGRQNALRFGRKGSFLMNISGPKAGQWYDFSTGEWGDILKLVQRETSLNRRQALNYLAQNLNVQPKQRIVPKALSKAPIEDMEDKAELLQTVQYLYEKSRCIFGSPADRYLRKTRGIQGDLAPDLRFLEAGTSFFYRGEPKALTHACLASFGRDSKGKLLSVQVTKLTLDGRRAETRAGEKLSKLIYGISKGSFVTLQKGKIREEVLIAEGVETALSLKEAGVRGKVVAAQGVHNIRNYAGPEERIILCADNDDHNPKSGTAAVVFQAQAHFTSENKSVYLIKPQTPGQDFNDVLREKGVAGLWKYVNQVTLEIQNVQTHSSSARGWWFLAQLLTDFRNTPDPELKDTIQNELRAFKSTQTPQTWHHFKTTSPELASQIQAFEEGIKEKEKGKSLGR